MTDMVQEEARMELVGVVVPPPTAVEVVARVCDAAERKQSLLLTPAECRVLVGLLV